jgi:sporulation protein YlmC with PRC-barrel domain
MTMVSKEAEMNETIAKKTKISSRLLIGSVVKNKFDEDLGEIEEMLVDPGTGFISEVILSTTKFLVLEKRIAVPWDMFQIDEEDNYLRINVDKEFLSRIPSYRGSYMNALENK